MVEGRGVVLSLAVACSSATGIAQVVLEPLPVMKPRAAHVMVNIGASVLMTGGSDGVSPQQYDDVWITTGAGWVRIGSLQYSGTIVDAAFDLSRQIFVGVDELGGLGVSLLEWNGLATTTPATPPAAFAPTVQHAIVFDPSRNTCVLRGLDLATDSNQLWSYDGTNWQPLSIGGVGPSLGEFRLLTEPSGGFLLVGGGALGASVETWRWHQGAWSFLSTPACSASRFAATNDTATGAPLLAGYTSSGTLLTVWEWSVGTWTPIGAGGPDLGAGFRMAHDGTALVLYGGTPYPAPGPVYGDTWMLQGGVFQQIASAPPGALDPVSGCLDELGQRTVLVGRAGPRLETWETDGAQFRRIDAVASTANAEVAFDRGRSALVQYRSDGETSEWNGSAWVTTVPAGAGPVRDGAALAYDGQRVILFGGASGLHGGFNETWAYDGVAWSQLFPAVSPPTGLDRPRLVEDRRRGVVVLASNSTGQLHEWNGANWSAPIPAPALATVRETFVGWHPARGRVVLGGGATATVPPSPSTAMWEWDGANLSPLVGLAAARARGALVGMRDGDALIVGGHGAGAAPATDLTAIRSLHAARVVPIGSGCGAGAVLPRLCTDPWRWPWSLDVTELRASELPGVVPAALWAMGLSDAADAFGPLPRDLAWAGAPLCFQRTAVDLAFVLPVQQGVSTWSTFVPPGLEGLSFHFQVLALDPAANPGGFVLTNAVRATIGTR